MSSAKKITATEAGRSFSDVVARVRYRGERFIVEKGGEAVCQISPIGPAAVRSTVSDLRRLLDELPEVDEAYRRIVREGAHKQPKLPRSPWDS